MPLPSKELFTLQEIIDRWSSHGCDRATLHHYASEDSLVFSVYLRDLGSHRVERLTDRGLETTTVETLQFFGPSESQPIRYLRGEDARRIFEALPDEKIAVNRLYTRVERDKESGAAYGSPKYFAEADLFVTRAERDRFERFHGLADEPPTSISGAGPVQRLLTLCVKFPDVVRQLRHRRSERETLLVNDEYDAQDLMHALLRIDFADIRAEEYSPSHAGGNSRVDFLLNDESIVLELKMTREKLRDKDVGEQLIVDIERYRKHPKCKTLVCLVYDPEHRILNRAGLEADLSKTEPDYEVYARIVG